MSSSRCPLAVWLTFLLCAETQPAFAQRCPPNSHAASVAFAGSLRTAQCFCNFGYRPAGRACVPVVTDPASQSQPRDPSRSLVQPRPAR